MCFHLYVKSKQQHTQTHRNRDQRMVARGEGDEGIAEKGEWEYSQ